MHRLSTEHLEYKQRNSLKELAKQFTIVNDPGERTVALLTRFNESGPKTEKEKQYFYRVIEQHRRDFPSFKKTAIVESLRRRN